MLNSRAIFLNRPNNYESFLISIALHFILIFFYLKTPPVINLQKDIGFRSVLRIKIIKDRPVKEGPKKTTKQYIKKRKFSKLKQENSEVSPHPFLKEPPQKIVMKDFNKSIVQNVPPIYPRIALKNGQSGSVLVSLLVDATGKVIRVNLVRSSSYDLLDKSALHAATQWIFRKSDSGLPYRVEKKIIFKIKSD